MEDRSPALQDFLRDLKAAREYQRVPLERIAGETHISLDFLQALEEGAWERIPGPFLRGYLTAYAECVGMVRDKVLKRFDELDLPRFPRPVGQEIEAAAPRSPFPSSRATAREAPLAPVAPARPARRQVPSFLEVLPTTVKAGLALALVLLAAVLVWGVTVLVLQAWPDGAQSDELASAPPRHAEAEVVTLQGSAPYDVRFRLTRSGQVRAFSQDSLYHDGVASAGQPVAFRSTTEVVLQAERLEDLQVWRDGRPLDLPRQTGPAELRLTRQSVRVIARKVP